MNDKGIHLRISAMWLWIAAFSMAGAAFCPVSAQTSPGTGRPVKPNDEIVILGFGDSLMAGYMLPPAKSFPAQLEAALRAKGYTVRVINSGVSGDTAADGLARLDWSVSEKIDAAIVEFGANEALRGQPPSAAEGAIDQIVTQLKARGAEILLAGMEAPRNWGTGYADELRAIYPGLAAKHGALLYPFFLNKVATVRPLNLADGIHPTADGVAVIVREIMPDVETLIARVQARRAQG